MVGGFNDFANLRLRDHRPGNGQYQLPPVIGPGSESSKRSILHKCPPPPAEATGAGPGDYAIPSCIGTGPALRFGPQLEIDERGAPIFPPPSTSTRGGDADAAEAVAVRPLAAQYSMALSPDTPAYSIYSKLPAAWERAATGSVGPGEYNLPSTFTRRTWGVPEGAHLGVRRVSAAEREKMKIPGPGTYHLTRFGDQIPAAKEPPLRMRRQRRAETTPGPGAYDDPTTIEARARAPRLRMVATCTFGSRWKGHRHRAGGPGPGTYNTTTPGVARLLERRQRHAPQFVQPSDVAAAPAPTRRGRKCDPGYTLPSDFDYSYKKGKSMMGRWRESKRIMEAAGPGAYDTTSTATMRSPPGSRFAAGPFDPYAALRAAAEEQQQEQAKAGIAGGLGPTSYNVAYTQVDKHCRGALFGSGAGGRNDDNGVPGPGHYNPNYTAPEPEGRGTIFYKGSFNDEQAAESSGGGPGANYNDHTMYSQSIAGDKAAGKGFTMRSRYPARATHQVCKPYDETTNINCVYPDELTWETVVRLPQVSTKK